MGWCIVYNRKLANENPNVVFASFHAQARLPGARPRQALTRKIAAAYPPHHPDYIGITLQEYFKIGKSRDELAEIDEESQSSVSGGTPCFGGGSQVTPDTAHPHKKRRTKMKTEMGCDILGEHGAALRGQKVITLNLEETNQWDKNVVKLPNIHEHRHKNGSRQGFTKDTKEMPRPEKKDSLLRTKAGDSHASNLVAFLKQTENSKAVARNMNNVRKSIRSRVTSSSFYQMNLREKERGDRERIKTEEEDAHLEKSFVITRYGALRGKDEGSLRKYEQSFKLTRQ